MKNGFPPEIRIEEFPISILKRKYVPKIDLINIYDPGGGWIIIS